MPFLSDQENWRATSPFLQHFFLISSDQNFEMAVFFSIIERPNNYVYRDKIAPHISWGTVFKLLNLPVVLFAIGKHAYIFHEGREGRIFCLEDILHGENFTWREEFIGDEYSRGSFTLGEFDIISIRNFYICLSLSLPIEFQAWIC